MNGLRVDNALQAVRFACAAAYGAGAYLLYRGVTALRRPKRWLRGMLLDAAFWLIALTAFTLLILGPCGGELRLYHLCGVCAGGAALAWIRGRHKEKT